MAPGRPGTTRGCPISRQHTKPAYYPPNAQNAVRQAKLLARNIIATLHGGPIAEYRHKSLGTLASYGVGKGAAVVFGIPLKGLPAWLVDRVYHGMSMPTYARKFRIFSGWFVNLFTPRDITPMTVTEHPRRSFVGSMRASAKPDAGGPPQ